MTAEQVANLWSPLVLLFHHGPVDGLRSPHLVVQVLNPGFEH